MDGWSNNSWSNDGSWGRPFRGRGRGRGYSSYNNDNSGGGGNPGNWYSGSGWDEGSGPVQDNRYYYEGPAAAATGGYAQDNRYYYEGPAAAATGGPAGRAGVVWGSPMPSGSGAGNAAAAGTAASGSQGIKRKIIPFAGLVPPLEDNEDGEIAFQNISDVWEVSKSGGDVKKALEEVYRRSGNPYVMALFLMVRCKDFSYQMKGPLLSLIVIQELEKYLEGLTTLDIRDTKVQLAALRLATKQRNKELENLLLKVYKIKEIETEVIEFIRGLVKTKEYDEACQLARAARIDCFGIEEFLTPLIFQDKRAVVENYLEFSKQMQDKLTTFVDGFLYHGGNLDFNLDQYIRENNITITPQQRSRFTEKSLKKLVKKWVNMFGNPAAAPNVQQSVGCGQIKFLIGQRYELDSLAEANFLELLAACIRTDTTSSATEYAFRSILNYGDTEAAVKLVREHNIDISNTPEYIQSIVNRAVESQSNQNGQPALKCWEEENWETGETVVRQESTETRSESIETSPESNVYALPIPVTNIVIVSNEAEVSQFCDYISNRLQSANMLESGFDCEWKSIQPECAALLQISFSGVVFLVDLFTLRNQFGCESLFETLSHVYFSNPNILKLGYDYASDITMLSRVHPVWMKLRLSMKNTIDLRVLKAKITQKIPDFFEGLYSSGEMKEGLSDFILQCLGQTLSKEEQISNWERRPLRDSQIIYAAADCYCLLDVFSFLKNAESIRSYGITELLQD